MNLPSNDKFFHPAKIESFGVGSGLGIKTDNIQKVFRTEEVETWALNDVSLEIDLGEFVAIMGPSGCGKSTLLNILGLLDNPTGGAYFLNGTNVGAFPENQRTQLRKGVILCFKVSTLLRN